MDERIENRLEAIIVERLFLKIEPSEIGDDDSLMKVDFRQAVLDAETSGQVGDALSMSSELVQ